MPFGLAHCSKWFEIGLQALPPQTAAAPVAVAAGAVVPMVGAASGEAEAEGAADGVLVGAASGEARGAETTLSAALRLQL